MKSRLNSVGLYSLGLKNVTWSCDRALGSIQAEVWKRLLSFELSVEFFACHSARKSSPAGPLDVVKLWIGCVSERIAEIGPLPIAEGETYSAQYMEAIFTPGMTSRAHIHSGPEAWYTLTGETCLETPQGKQVGRAGGQYVIVPGGPPTHLTATGTETRRAIVLILHDSSKPASTPVYDWTPKVAVQKLISSK